MKCKIPHEKATWIVNRNAHQKLQQAHRIHYHQNISQAISNSTEYLSIIIDGTSLEGFPHFVCK